MFTVINVVAISQIDILVNNGARDQRAWIKDTPVEVDRDIINILVMAQISLTKAVLPHFLEQKAGHFVLTSSGSGKLGNLGPNLRHILKL